MPKPAAALPRRRVGPVTPHLYQPTAERPLRVKNVLLRADTDVVPHQHPWAQFAFSTHAVTRLTVAQGSFIVPPSRALWIPPGVAHAVTVLEDTHPRTLYLHQAPGQCGPGVPRAEQAAWAQCRVLEVSGLLRALLMEFDVRPDDEIDEQVAPPPERRRERLLSALVLDELRRAQPVRLGVDLPADKRLRALCEAVIDDPRRHATLDGWAADAGASPRTVARLFRQQLGTSFAQWRQQVLLAKAVSLAAQKRPIDHIAGELGYASPSAFSAMVRRSLGLSPRELFGRQAENRTRTIAP